MKEVGGDIYFFSDFFFLLSKVMVWVRMVVWGVVAWTADIYSCPNPTVSSTAKVNLLTRTSYDLYGGKSIRLKLISHGKRG